MTTTLLALAWLALAAVPVVWWLWTRTHVDVWRVLPVPAALLDDAGAVRHVAGPATEADLGVPGALPAPGRVQRARSADGTPLALTGLRGGALALALPADPVGDRRDRVLADLGARLAHDINTPLAALQGHLDLLLHEPVTDRGRDSILTCQRELTRLQTTAQDLLAFTRLRGGGGRRTVQLAGVLAEEAAAALLDLADSRDATLTVEVPHEHVEVEAAEADIVRALRNLLANALAHGLGERRVVRLDVDADDDSVSFTVADSGPGLDQDELDRLSEPMVRGPQAAAAGTPGSGLGLAIVAEVLVAHGAALRSTRTADGLAALAFTLRRHQPC